MPPQETPRTFSPPDGERVTPPSLSSDRVTLTPATEIAWQTVFEQAPIGLLLSENRLIRDCNQQWTRMFGVARADIIGRSLEVLYPSADEFERTGQRIAARLDAQGRYEDERVMRRIGGARAGELFWCHVCGRALDAQRPHASGIWSFEDLSSKRQLQADLTPREREIAALLIEGMTSKLIGKRLAISPRTVDVHRARLMKKFSVNTTPELLNRLLRA
jgi:PAS domain S-box-containing protein